MFGDIFFQAYFHLFRYAASLLIAGQKLWHSVLYMRDTCRVSICLVSHVHLLLHISFTKNIEEGMHLFGLLLGSIMGLHRDKELNIAQKEQMLHL